MSIRAAYNSKGERVREAHVSHIGSGAGNQPLVLHAPASAADPGSAFHVLGSKFTFT